MNDELFISGVICRQLAAGLPVVLVSIVDSSGSSPRRSGSKMVVGTDEIYGTIGGGLLELRAIEESRLALQDGLSRVDDFGFRGNSTSSDEMLCGGSAKLLFDFLSPGAETLDFFTNYRKLIEDGAEFFALTALKSEHGGIEISGRSLYLRNGTILGASPWTEQQFEALKSELRQISSAELLSLAGLNIVADPIRRTKTLYCFGGGHVAMAAAHLAALVGFRVVVLDDREDYANAERFPDAEKTIVVADFDTALDGLQIDADSFLVIVTRGHRHDRIVLEQALKTQAGYIGMIGSRRKRQIIYAELEAKGFSRERLAQVHCPTGLAINAETPEEIGVSIVAELIQTRARPL